MLLHFFKVASKLDFPKDFWYNKYIMEKEQLMFKARYRKDNIIYQVLDTTIDSTFGNTLFLVWMRNHWEWLPAKDFVPPNFQ